jgi:hypothetical protein
MTLRSAALPPHGGQAGKCEKQPTSDDRHSRSVQYASSRCGIGVKIRVRSIRYI